MSRVAVAQIINSSIEEINVTYSAISSVSAVFISNPKQINTVSKRKLTVDSPFAGQLTKLAAVTAAAAGILTSMHAILPSVHFQNAETVQSPSLAVQKEKQNLTFQNQKHSSAKSNSVESASANQTAPLEAPHQDSVEMSQLTRDRHQLLTAALRAETVQALPKPSTSEVKIENPAANSEDFQGLADLIVSEALHYRGVPFVWGGTQPSGFDCSGFVQYVFKRLGIKVPRMSYDQAEIGVPISYNHLQKGDLVFFQTDQAGASHVGFYLGNHLFVHADATRGISVASLANPYWNTRFYSARRLNE